MSNAASISEQTLAAIGALFGDRATRSEAICMRHARSEAYHVPLPPDVVVFP